MVSRFNKMHVLLSVSNCYTPFTYIAEAAVTQQLSLYLIAHLLRCQCAFVCFILLSHQVSDLCILVPAALKVE